MKRKAIKQFVPSSSLDKKLLVEPVEQVNLICECDRCLDKKAKRVSRTCAKCGKREQVTSHCLERCQCEGCQISFCVACHDNQYDDDEQKIPNQALFQTCSLCQHEWSNRGSCEGCDYLRKTCAQCEKKCPVKQLCLKKCLVLCPCSEKENFEERTYLCGRHVKKAKHKLQCSQCLYNKRYC